MADLTDMWLWLGGSVAGTALLIFLLFVVVRWALNRPVRTRRGQPTGTTISLANVPAWATTRPGAGGWTWRGRANLYGQYGQVVYNRLGGAILRVDQTGRLTVRYASRWLNWHTGQVRVPDVRLDRPETAVLFPARSRFGHPAIGVDQPPEPVTYFWCEGYYSRDEILAGLAAVGFQVTPEEHLASRWW